MESQSIANLVRDDDEDEIEPDNEGMTQLRGEASRGQDKFRITVECEQRCYTHTDTFII